MDELGAAGLLETSTGLAVLSALFLLAALHSGWSERRAHRARRAKLLAALDDGPRKRGTAGVAEPHPAPPHQDVELEASGGATVPGAHAALEVEGASAPASARELAGPRPDEAAPCAAAVADALTLGEDDGEEIVAAPDAASASHAGDPRQTPDAPAAAEADQLRCLDELIEQRAFREARALLAELAQRAPRDHQLRRRAGRLALACGRPEAAVRLFEACLERDPGDLESRLAACAAHAELRSFEDVVRHARRGLELLPEESRLLVHLSEAAFELGAPEEALELATRALRSRPRPESFFHLARLLAMTRRLAPNDCERLRHALVRFPGEPALLHAAGVFEAMYGTRGAARRILCAASEKEPTARHRHAIEREIAALRASEENAA